MELLCLRPVTQDLCTPPRPLDPRLREEVTTVSGMVTRALMPPTAGERLRTGELRTEADQAQARLDGIIQNRVLKINQALAGTPHVITPAARIVP